MSLEIVTYYCVYRYGQKAPVAMFLRQSEADDYAAFQAHIYGKAKRRVVINAPMEIQSVNQDERALNLLRTIVLGDDTELGLALDEATEFLKELTKEKNDKETISGGSGSRKEASKRTINSKIPNGPKTQ
jgi:hypothetical protein